MKEVVIISGKGGTGKTSLTASFAMLGGKDIVVADCDVDAADMHLLLTPDWAKTEDFYSGLLAYIDQEKCTGCGKCEKICRFQAIVPKKGKYSINELDCEGCGYCYHVCPVKAITMKQPQVGQLFISLTKAGNTMVHARLRSGADNSGKLVAKVKKEAKNIALEQKKELIVVDGSPGIGCPVVSSLSGASYVIIVTEPTVSGLHDMERIYQLVHKFKIPAGCIINKSDLNKDKAREIREYLVKEKIDLLLELPYDENFTKAMTAGKTIVEWQDSALAGKIRLSWKNLIQRVKQLQ